jgi:aspartate--ammonia ligase
LMQIWWKLKSWIKHDWRAPDYDDWKLNGDILVWNSTLKDVFELSSMWIRVDEKTLLKQLKIADCEGRKEKLFHQLLLGKKLPYTIWWWIWQSRLCMFFLEKLHIWEVQSSIWSDEIIMEYEKLWRILL